MQKSNPAYLDEFSNNKSNYGLAIAKFGNLTLNNGKYKLEYNKDNNLYLNFSYDSHKEILGYALKKQKDLIDELQKSNYNVMCIAVTQNWRLVINLGQESVYNNGFLFHPIYGIPYLPKKAIKGMLRTYVIETYFGFTEDSEKNAMEDSGFIKLFGTANEKDPTIGKQGLLRFANAFPTNAFKIELDIMNPHHTNYYKSNKLPLDNESPTPIKFITLKEASFEPFVYINKTENTPITNSEITLLNNSNLLNGASKLLYDAFEIKGIGAKTNKAYGRLIKNKNRVDKLAQIEVQRINAKIEAERREEERREEERREEERREEERRVHEQLIRDRGIKILLEGCTNFNEFKLHITYYETLNLLFTDNDIDFIKNIATILIKNKKSKFKDSLKQKINNFLIPKGINL